jgi:hypothetical protein
VAKPSIPESLEEALAQLAELQKQKDSAESEAVKLKATNEGLMRDLRKKKQVDTFLKVAGIDLTGDLDEDEIASAIVNLRAAPSESQEPPTPTPIPQSTQPAAGQIPSDAMNEAMKAQFASLRKELADLRKAKEAAEESANQERERRRHSKLEQLVRDELSKADCSRPQHLFKLMQGDFRLLEDETTVVFGPEDNPVSLRDAVSRLREDDEFSLYFRGSGATGSGLTPARPTTGISTNNPFATGSVNATDAARMMQENPDKARRMINEARASGKLDPIMAKAFAK